MNEACGGEEACGEGVAVAEEGGGTWGSGEQMQGKDSSEKGSEEYDQD